MKIVAPTRFFAGTSTDQNYQTQLWKHRLVAREDLVCQYTQNSDKTVQADWKEIQQVTTNASIKWLRFSYDLGQTYSVYIPLNSGDTSIITTFQIPPDVSTDTRFLVGQNNPYYDEDPTYNYCFRYEFQTVEQFNQYKYSQISLFIQSDSGIILSISAPIIMQKTDTGGYLDILFADEFFEQYTDYTCIIKIK